MTPQTKQPKTLQQAIIYFSDIQNAIDFIAALRWSDGVTCPHCQSKENYYLPPRKIWRCKNKACKKDFSVKVGTIFEDSPIGLDKWLAAIWMIANAKNGISSYEIHRALGVTQKSAWFMSHRIRLAATEYVRGNVHTIRSCVEHGHRQENYLRSTHCQRDIQAVETLEKIELRRHHETKF